MLTDPGGGMVGAKVAFMEYDAVVFSSPMQLGPTSRIPKRRTRSIISRSRRAPAGPVSLKPAEITTSAFTPF